MGNDYIFKLLFTADAIAEGHHARQTGFFNMKLKVTKIIAFSANETCTFLVVELHRGEAQNRKRIVMRQST